MRKTISTGKKAVRHKNLRHFDVSESSDRLILETLTAANMSPNYADWLRDPEVIRYLEMRRSAWPVEKIADYVQDMYVSDDNLMTGIFLKSGKTHIGNVRLGPVNWRYRRAYIGIMIGDRSSWGRGFATEAIECMCRIAFDTIGLRCVAAGSYASNQASIRAFLKAGFKEECVIEDYILDERKQNVSHEDQVWLARHPAFQS